MDPKHEPEVKYLRRLSKAKRTAANDYFNHGVVMRDLPHQPHLPPDSVVSLAWLSKDGFSLLIPITAVKREGEYNIKMKINIGRYGIEG